MKNCRKWMVLIFHLVFLCMSSPAFAATQTVEADGYYTVGDGVEENFSVARERAKQDALGRAAEMAAVYVEKFTAVKNHQLTASEIKTLAAKVLNVMDAVFENTTEGNVFKIRCHVVAQVEDENALAAMMSDREKLEESLQREREKDEQIAKLNRQMEELQKQYQAAKTDGERAAIRREAQVNDVSFKVAQLVEKAVRACDNQFYISAMYYCTDALALDPNSAWAYNVLGSALYGKKDYDEAIKYHNKAIALEPDYANAYVNLGRDYYGKSEYDKAIESCEKAVALKPDANAYFYLGLFYSTLIYYESAIESYSKAIALNPKFAAAYNDRGVVYFKMGERKKAKRDFAKAYELNPSNWDIKRNREHSENW